MSVSDQSCAGGTHPCLSGFYYYFFGLIWHTCGTLLAEQWGGGNNAAVVKSDIMKEIISQGKVDKLNQKTFEKGQNQNNLLMPEGKLGKRCLWWNKKDTQYKS